MEPNATGAVLASRQTRPRGRRHSKAGKHGAGHRHRSAESRASFYEGAESEGDQQCLQSRIGGEVADGIL